MEQFKFQEKKDREAGLGVGREEVAAVDLREVGGVGENNGGEADGEVLPANLITLVSMGSGGF